MRDIFIVLACFSTIPLTLLRPHIGILAWCWISYMNPHRLSWGFAYDARLALVVAAATLFAWMISKETKRIQINAVTGLLLAYLFWMSFANLFALVPDLAFDKWEEIVKILVMTFIAMILINNRERLHAFIWVIIASLMFFGVKGGIFTILSGGSYHVWGPPGSFIEDNNALAMALLMVLPLLWYLQIHSESKLLRLTLFASLGLFAFSIIGSQSRGAFLGSVMMMGFLVLKSRRRVMFGVTIVAVLIVAAAFVPDTWIDRMRTIETYQEDGSAMTRLEVWGFAVKIALDHPIFGGGFRVSYDDSIFLRYIPDALTGGGRNFHSIYFEVLGELGFIGLGLFLALMAAAWRAGSWTIKRTAHNPELTWANDLARMTQVSLVGYATAGAFQNLAFFDLYFHLVAILFITQQVVARSLNPDPAGARKFQPAPVPARAIGAKVMPRRVGTK
ncbi:MAG: putative O-glycosylation ligase, exosortase A system-associated [Kiloniellaceae bacterium]